MNRHLSRIVLKVGRGVFLHCFRLLASDKLKGRGGLAAEEGAAYLAQQFGIP